MKTLKIVLVLISCVALSACVSKKKYEELSEAKRRSDLKLSEVSKENKALSDKLTAKTKEATKLNEDLESLKKEFNDIKNEMLENNARKTTLIEELNRKLAMLSSDHKSAKDSLQKMLARLDVRDKKYAERQKELSAQLADLEGISEALNQYGTKLSDMEKFIIHNFDKNNISAAYTAINGGFLYITFNPGLLFKAGGTELQPEGKRALKIIAAALESSTPANCAVAANWAETETLANAWNLTQQRANQVFTYIKENGNQAGTGFSVSSEKVSEQKIGENKHEIALVLFPPLQNITKFTE